MYFLQKSIIPSHANAKSVVSTPLDSELRMTTLDTNFYYPSLTSLILIQNEILLQVIG